MENDKIISGFKFQMPQFSNGLNIIFFGTAEFGAIILEKLIKNSYKPVLVITEPDKPAGRHQRLTPPPVKIIAQNYNIPLLQPTKIKNLKFEIKNSKFDLIIVAAYGRILPKKILSIPTYGSLNIHPSLLPKYRGPSPIQSAVLNGDKETGVTIILMDEKIDHGPVLARQELEVPNPPAVDGIPSQRNLSQRDKSQFPIKPQIPITKITYQELHDALATIGAELLIKTIPEWINGEIKPRSQNDSEATYTKIFKKEDASIDWQKSAQEIERQIRALTPWPGTYCLWQKSDTNQQTLKILEAEVSTEKNKKQVGEVFLTNEGKLAIRTGQNSLILRKLQLEGKKPMMADDFLCGHQNIIGTILQ